MANFCCLDESELEILFNELHKKAPKTPKYNNLAITCSGKMMFGTFGSVVLDEASNKQVLGSLFWFYPILIGNGFSRTDGRMKIMLKIRFK